MRPPNAPKYGCGYDPNMVVSGERKFISANTIHAHGSQPKKEDKGKQIMGAKKGSKVVRTHESKNYFYADYVMMRHHNGKVVAKFVGTHTKGKQSKRNVWVPKMLVTNMQGPKFIWVPKTQA